MGPQFSAFSFVDRVTEVEPGLRAGGRFAIPEGLPDFPSCLVAEAVGQLAAWAAMAGLRFQRRPVAGLTGHVEVLGSARAGQTLDLGVELETCDPDAVAYRGWALVNGSPVLRLSRCVGPMLPMEEFDDPRTVEDHFALLCGPGATPGRFPGVTVPVLLPVDTPSGEAVRAAMQVPASAPFFADHFPRRPVFPGSLLLDAQMRLAVRVPLPVQGLPLVPRHVSDTKLRAFLAPGQVVELEARLLPEAGPRGATVAVVVRANGKSVASARVALISQEAT